jgi:hypothetical protein
LDGQQIDVGNVSCNQRGISKLTPNQKWVRAVDCPCLDVGVTLLQIAREPQRLSHVENVLQASYNGQIHVETVHCQPTVMDNARTE